MKGVLNITVEGRNVSVASFKNLTVDGKSNDGKLDAKYQCTDLVIRYGQQLGLPIANVGNGTDAAKNFAAQSNGEFSYVTSGSAGSPPKVGSVVSFGAFGSDPYGHVGVVQSVKQIDANTVQVTMFDQNRAGQPYKNVTFKNDSHGWNGAMQISDTGGRNMQTVQVDGWANPN